MMHCMQHVYCVSVSMSTPLDKKKCDCPIQNAYFLSVTQNPTPTTNAHWAEQCAILLHDITTNKYF